MTTDKEKTTKRVGENFLDWDRLGAIVFLVVVVSLGVSLYRQDGSWFGRSGSIATLFGLVRSGRALMRNSIWDEVRVDFGQIKAEEIEQRERANRSHDLAAAQEGMVYVAVGTIIWGYGDLIGMLLR